MLEAFARWQDRPKAVVVVVDHQQRSGSASEAARVVDVATGLGLKALSASVTPAQGDEASLRRARYAALRQEARRAGIAVVMVAHHGDDVAEGTLLHLLGMGGGRDGAAPRAVDVRHDLDGQWVLLRPFLGLQRTVLRAPLEHLGIKDFVVDGDDADGKNRRARLRKDVLPLLEAWRPGVAEALRHHASRIADDDDCLMALVPPTDVVDADLAPALLRRWLKVRIATVGPADPRTAPSALAEVLRLAAEGTPGTVHVRGAEVQISRHPGRGVVVAVVPRARQSATARPTGPVPEGDGAGESSSDGETSKPFRGNRSG